MQWVKAGLHTLIVSSEIMYGIGKHCFWPYGHCSARINLKLYLVMRLTRKILTSLNAGAVAATDHQD